MIYLKDRIALGYKSEIDDFKNVRGSLIPRGVGLFFLRPTAHMSNGRKPQCIIRCIFNGFLTHFLIQFNNNVVTYWCGSE